MSKKKFLLGSAIAGITAGVVVGTPIVIGWLLTHPRKEKLTCHPSAYELIHEDIVFNSHFDDIQLKGWWIPAQVNGITLETDKTIIISHGYRSSRNMFEISFDNFIRKLSGEGYNLLLFDFRNSGESDGNLTSIGQLEKYDLLAAIDYAIEVKNSSKIGLIGFSMGASTSILAGAESEKVKVVIADSPFADLKEYLNDNLSVWSRLPKKPFTPIIMKVLPHLTGLNPEEVSPRTAVKDAGDTFFLLIHSKEDSKIPHENSIEIFEAVEDKDKISLWLPDKGDHVESFVYNREEYERHVFEVLEEHLA